MSPIQILSIKQITYKLNLIVAFQFLFESIVLGSLSNIVINFILNPLKPDFILNEFLVASFLSIPIVLYNQIINLNLEHAYSWKIQPTKRIFYHFTLLALILLLSINLLGNVYLAIVENGYFDFKELVIINLLTLIVAGLLTIFRWTKYFYKRWLSTDLHLYQTQKELDSLKKLEQFSIQKIELQKGTQQYFVEVHEILWAKTEDGIVWVALKNGNHFINKNTLSQLMQMLPESQFFLVSRNVIVSKELISNISPSTYGKVSLTLKDSIRGEKHLTVSRPKAATFRKWFNSNSTCN